MVQVLDRQQPLWELWFVEGVDRGEHVGLIHKSHHTLTDGISGVDIATVLLDFSVEPAVLPPDDWEPVPGPDPTRLMIDSVRERFTRPAELAGAARQLADGPREAMGTSGRPRSIHRLTRRRAGRCAAAVDERHRRPRPAAGDGARPARRREARYARCSAAR